MPPGRTSARSSMRLAEEQAAGAVTTETGGGAVCPNMPRFDRTAAPLRRTRRRRDDWSGVELVPAGRGRPRARRRRGAGILSAALLPHVARAVAFDESEALLATRPRGVEASSGDADALPFAGRVVRHRHLRPLAAPPPDPETGWPRWRGCWHPAAGWCVQDYIADPDPEQAREWDEIERLRDPAVTARLLRRGEVAGADRARRGLAVDDETEWTSTWDAGRWISMAERGRGHGGRAGRADRLSPVSAESTGAAGSAAADGPAPRTPRRAAQPRADQLDGVHRDGGRQLRLAGRRSAAMARRA